MTNRPSISFSHGSTLPPIRVGAVSYLNSKTLIYGLDRLAGVQLSLDVPSRLIDGLQENRFDIALLPVIDYQRMNDLVVVSSGGIGCDGETLTVRLFSRTPLEQTATLACDPDSHTSVALARIILQERYGIRPELIELTKASDRAGETRLLIGDKVVTSEPAGFGHQLDLGAAWKELTGRPFVFAVWTARKGVDLRDLPEQLISLRNAGHADLDRILADFAPTLGWPTALARRYLTEYLKFDIGQPQLDAIALFHEKAAAMKIIPSPARALELYSSRTADQLRDDRAIMR